VVSRKKSAFKKRTFRNSKFSFSKKTRKSLLKENYLQIVISTLQNTLNCIKRLQRREESFSLQGRFEMNKAIELKVKGKVVRIVKFLVSCEDLRKDVVDWKDAIEALKVLEKYDVIFRYLRSEYDKDGTWNTYCLIGKSEDIDFLIRDYNNWF